MDGDKKLNHDEFANGLAAGLHLDAPELVEVQARASRRNKKFFRAIGGFFRRVGQNLAGVVQSVTGRVDAKQDGCVMCQYLVERMENNVKAAGVIPSTASFYNPSDVACASFVETEAKTEDPLDFAGAAIIGATRASSRVQRQLERQKYNEIYRVVDITLDDVCEQGMPNSFYGYCKQAYTLQSDIVDGLRYQYHPSDICFRIGMCAKDSYITKGLHSRFK